MKMKLMNNKKKYLRQKISQKLLLCETTIDFILKVSKSYVLLHVNSPLLCILCWFFTSAADQKTIFIVEPV